MSFLMDVTRVFWAELTGRLDVCGGGIVVDCKLAPREDEKHTFRIGIK